MYAEFGATIHQAQLLEGALRLLLLVGREYTKAQIPDEAIRYPVGLEGRKTLGMLFNEAMQVEPVPEKDREMIQVAIELRNHLIHSFWGERAAHMLTPEGRRALVEELKQMWTFLRGVTAIVHRWIDRYLAAYGMSVQKFMDQPEHMYVGDEEPPDYKGLIH